MTLEAIAITLKRATAYSNYVGALMEATVIVFLITSLYRREVYFQSAYFVIYLIGLIVDFFNAFIWFLDFVCLNYSLNFLLYFDNVSYWYVTIFLGFWNSILAVNRFTALLYPLRQSRVS